MIIEEVKAFLSLFRQGKEITKAATWKNNTIAVNTLVGFLGSALLVAKGFGYEFNIKPEEINSIALGIVTLLGAINGIVHVITSKKVGLPAVPSSSEHEFPSIPIDDTRRAGEDPLGGGQ